MSAYMEARTKLRDSLLDVEPDGPEWRKIEEAIRELDAAETAEAEADFVSASQGIGVAVDRLKSIVSSISPNAATSAMDGVRSALNALTPVTEGITALLAGEPAPAPLSSEDANANDAPDAPEATPPAPPLRERARPKTKPAPVTATTSRTPEQMIEDILRREGGFVNHPADRGGATNFGVTQATLSAWRGHPATVDDVRQMSIDEARQIYRANYFQRPKIDRLPDLLQPLVFDMSINHGPGTAAKLLQRVLRENGQPCSVDGGIGDETVRCADTAAGVLGTALINSLVDRRIKFYRDIVARNASQQVFLKGWLKRAEEFRLA